MKRDLLLRIASTNLVSCLRMLAAACVAGFFYMLFQEAESIPAKIFGALLGPLVFLLSFGLIFWTGFILLTFLLDVVLFSLKLKPFLVIILEAVVIGGMLLYWAISNDYPLWLGLAGIYLPLQWLRLRDITRLISDTGIRPDSWRGY
jgi:hypothetical protein